MGRWLIDHPDQWDVLVVFGTIEGGEELFLAAEGLGKPCVVQLSETGPGTTLENPRTLQRIQRRLQAWARQKYWITTDGQSAANIHSLNPSAEVKIWNLGLPPAPDWTPAARLAQRTAARAALIETNDMLRSTRQTPLVIYNGPLDDGADSQWLWQLLQRVTGRRNDFRVWLCTDGPAGFRIYHAACESSVEDRILLPGYFCDIQDLALAADVMIMPQSERRNSFDWLQAIATGTPVLIAASSTTEQLLRESGREAWEFERVIVTKELDRWCERLLDLLQDLPEGMFQAGRLRDALLPQHAIAITLESYRQHLLSCLQASPPPTKPGVP